MVFWGWQRMQFMSYLCEKIWYFFCLVVPIETDPTNDRDGSSFALSLVGYCIGSRFNRRQSRLIVDICKFHHLRLHSNGIFWYRETPNGQLAIIWEGPRSRSFSRAPPSGCNLLNICLLFILGRRPLPVFISNNLFKCEQVK